MRDELASTRPPTLRAERTLAARAAVVLAAVLGTLVPAVDGGAVAAPEAHWNRRFVGNAEELAVDARGNTFVVGTRRIDRYHRAIVTRYGPEGRVLWRRRWGSDRLYTQGSAIAVADDGNVIVAGTIQPEGLCGGWFVRAYGRNGERRWHREQDGARTCRQYDGVTAVDVGEDSIVIVGNEVSDGIGWVAGWIVSLSLDGRVQWRRPFDVPDAPERWYDDLSDGRSTTEAGSTSSARRPVGARTDGSGAIAGSCRSCRLRAPRSGPASSTTATGDRPTSTARPRCRSLAIAWSSADRSRGRAGSGRVHGSPGSPSQGSCSPSARGREGRVRSTCR